MRLRFIPFLVAFVCFGAGSFAGYVFFDRTFVSLPRTTGIAFDARPPLDLPAIQTMTATATTDADALALIRAYADSHDLMTIFHEANQDRARALFAMYLVHLSHPYNEETYQAPTLLDFIRVQHWTNCALSARYQQQIAQVLGLTTRLGSGFDHSWMEVQIGNQWETFDSTVNTWFSTSYAAMEHGLPREYETFYTPALDAARPEARAHVDTARGYGYYDVAVFRDQLIGLGIFWRKTGAAYR